MAVGLLSLSEPWRGAVLVLPGGQVLLGGSALADVVRALEAAQHVTRRDGYDPHQAWLELLEQFRAAQRHGQGAAVGGSAELPPTGSLSWSAQDVVDTREAALMLGCGARNVRHLRARGVLESGRLGSSRRASRRLLFDRSEVAAEALRRQEMALATRNGAR